MTVLLSSDSPTERERTERLIKTKLREIMMQKDLENITSKEVSGEGAAVQIKRVLCAMEKGQRKKTHVVSLCSSTPRRYAQSWRCRWCATCGSSKSSLTMK